MFCALPRLFFLLYRCFMARFAKQAEKTPPRDDMSKVKVALKSVGHAKRA